ncbi:hypothetical protein [Actinosynnema sp. NPDC020468]|uniref:hypothetical protein n=1 Tax=Actinosynnema sp. NPDC020468 TaxID=3154488 RepID=UPI0033C70AF6
MSIVSAAKPTSRSWLQLLAWAQVTLGLAGLVAVLTSPAVGIAAGLAVALIGLSVRSLNRASRKMDQIFAEELR